MNVESFYAGDVQEDMPLSDIIALAVLKGWTLDDIAAELGIAISFQLAVCRRCHRFVSYWERLRGCGCVKCEYESNH